MNNYEYIIASLPVLQKDSSSKTEADEIIDFLREQLSTRDQALLADLLDGFKAEKLDKQYYRRVTDSRNSFIRGYFSYDLLLRNLKVQYLNQQLSRPLSQDTMSLETAEDEQEAAFRVSDAQEEAAAQINSALNQSDILSRERGLDELLWAEIDRLTEGKLFSIEVILGFVARLQIVDRWQRLDPQTGRALLRKAIESIRSTYDNKKQNII